VKFLARICPDEAIHEFEELDATTALTSPVATSKAGNKVDVPRITLGRRLLQKRCSLLFIARLLIRVPLFFHASKFMIGKSPLPIADNSGRIDYSRPTKVLRPKAPGRENRLNDDIIAAVSATTGKKG